MKKTYFVLLVLIALISCQKDSSQDELTTEKPTRIVSDEQKTTYTGGLLQFFGSIISDTWEDKNFQGVRTIKIIYKTVDQDNEPIEASGMLMIPESIEGNEPLISIQHGTLSEKSQAPTNSVLGTNEFTLGCLFSSIGSVVAISDYVGYGHSADQKHPYQHKENTAQSTYDFLLAVFEYLERENIPTNEELFLMGYSQGGHATMALHQKIEEESQLTVTHSMPAAGAYNITQFTQEILSKDEDLEFIGSYVWVIKVYNQMYTSLQRPLDFYFNEPYASQLSQLEEIDKPVNLSLIDPNPQKLFKKDLIDNILNGTDKVLLDVMAQNDVFDWKPTAPITLFHGTTDDYVYPSNSESAFAHIQSQGGDIRYVPLEGMNHQQAVMPYFLEASKIIFKE